MAEITLLQMHDSGLSAKRCFVFETGEIWSYRWH